MNISTLSIKQKFTVALLLTVLVSTLLVGVLSQMQARSLVTEQVETVVLPNILQRISNRIDKEISVLEHTTRQLTELTFVEEFMRNGHPAEDEAKIVEMLKRVHRQHGLSNASVVNRETAHYWNQDGFLRVLQDDQLDGWFYRYRASGATKSKSLYTEDNTPKLFINYQDVDGIVAAGIGRTVKGFVELLNSNSIGENGFVYLADANGTVKLHRNSSLLEKSDLQKLYGRDVATKLLGKQRFAMTEAEVDGENRYIASSYIENADWYVVAEVPVSDMFVELDSAAWQMALQIIAITILTALMAMWLATKLTHPITVLAETFAKLGAAEANLDVRLREQKEKELRDLQSGFNDFLGKIKLTIEDIASASGQLKTVTDTVANESGSVLNMGQTQASHTEQVTEAIERLNDSVSSIAENANQAATTASELHAVSTEGKQISAQARAAILDLNAHTNEVSASISNLAKHTESIEDVLNVIKGVSEQTNLLALNAAIEAARAGEQGRGFAVVADEVRSLAQRTHESTDEIGNTIQRLQEEVAKAVSLMEMSQAKSQEGDEAVTQNEQALQKIEANIADVTQVSLQVADTTKQQASVTEDIMQSLQAIRRETDAFLASSGQVSESTNKLRDLTRSLDELVSQYH